MRSLKLDTPKAFRQPRVAAKPSVSTAPRSGGIVPPAKTAPPRVGDGFERATTKPGRRGGSVFEPGGVKAGGIKAGGSRVGVGGGKHVLAEDTVANLTKLGSDIFTKLGAGAKKGDVRKEILSAVKGLNLGSRSLFGKAYRVAMHAYRSCGSSASGTRTFGTE